MPNDFLSYASQANVNATYSPETNSLTINGVPVNLGKSGLAYQGGQLVGDTAAYDALLSPFTQQYSAKAAGAVQEMQDFKPYETPEEYRAFMLSVINQANQKYQFNFDESPMVQDARETLEKSISDLASAHGFLYSGGTQQIIESQLKALAPQFEQAEYAKHQAFMDQQLAYMQTLTKWDSMQYDRSMDKFALIQQKANFIQSLSEMEFNRFKVMLQQHRDEQEIALSKERMELEKTKFETDNAYRKIAESGYVDNESAGILGIPAGTPARWVQEIELEHQTRIDLMKKENEYNIAMAKEQAKIEKELIDYQTELEVASKLRLMEEEFKYTSRLQDLKFVHQRELDAIAAAEKAKEDARKAAEKAAKEKESGLNISWSDFRKRFKVKFDTDNDGYLDPNSDKEAVFAWIRAEVDRGVSAKLIDQLVDTYDLGTMGETYGSPGTRYTTYKSSYDRLIETYDKSKQATVGPVAQNKFNYGLTGKPLF